MSAQAEKHAGTPEDPLDKVITVSNVITFIRLCMIPACLIALFSGNNILACILFSLTACTDWIDGQIARRTNTVSKLGRALDPAVDRLLMISSVIALYLVGRLPLWIIVLVLIRDIALIIGYLVLKARWNVRVDVIYLGKVCTTFFCIGFAGLILNMPLIPGLGWTSVPWLPGFNTVPCSWGIWFVYVGILIGIYTTGTYVKTAIAKINASTAS